MSSVRLSQTIQRELVPIVKDEPLHQVVAAALPCFDPTLTTLVRSYLSKLDPTVTIDYCLKLNPSFGKGTDHEECGLCTPTPTRLARLPDSLERRASMILTRAFSLRFLVAADIASMLPGIDLIEEADPSEWIVCSDIIFHHEPWFQGSRHLPHLLSDVLPLLCSNGYRIATKPSPGQVVLYIHGEMVEHYGRVVSLSPNGTLTVISKFGPYHVYRHRLEVVPLSYGAHYLLLDPPPTAPSVLYTSPDVIRAKTATK